MRAPFCNETSDICSDEECAISPSHENEQAILAIERSLERSHTGKTAVFGICLDDLMGTSTHVVPQIPFVLTRLCQYIETHGLRHRRLFKEGDNNNLVEDLKEEFVQHGDAPLESAGSVPSVAQLLIVFFEELPEPLIPVSAQPDIIQDMENLTLDPVDCISHLRGHVDKLPDSAYRVLKYLSRFLLRVSCHEEYNGMTCNNLATLFSPLIFRPSSKDPILLLKLQNVTKSFVRDYHTIFEDTSSAKDTQGNKMITEPSEKFTCPSSVAPLIPLSIFIPSTETNSPSDELIREKVPILLIEKLSEVPLKDDFSNSSSSAPIKIAMTRKRKERRLSGEDVQPRSSSEERPNSSALQSLERMDVIRRCNSHDEGMSDMGRDAYKTSSENDEGISESVCMSDDYLSTDIEAISEKNHSPHPPYAKRREMDATALSLDSNRWQHNYTKHPPSDAPCQRNSQQNPIADDQDKISMECELEEDSEDLASTLAGIPRSASCPVPKGDADDGAESTSSSLSLSWSMMVFGETEPVRSVNPLKWSDSSKPHDDVLLSPSIHSLRGSGYYEAPLSPSAYRTYLSYRGSHLDPSVPPSPPVEQEDFAKKLVESSGVSDSIRQLTKRIHTIKRRLRKFDEKYEAELGYKPSHAEKSTLPEGKKLLGDLYKARKELKVLKEEAHLEHASAAALSWRASAHVLEDTTNQVAQEGTKLKLKPSIEDSMGVTLRSLAEERKNANRPPDVEDMTNDQVKDEKLSIQKALLHFESIHGKPYSKDERNTIRPLYDRYRNVKKLLVRSGSFPGSTSKNKDSCSELQPILEHETMDFPHREHRPNEEPADPEPLPQADATSITKEEKATEVSEVTQEEQKSPSSTCFLVKYDNSNFHELPLSEMIFQMQKVKSEKRRLRKILKEFETEFFRLNGRKVQKEDKVPVDTLYNEYKHVKARLKLLEALLSKHDQYQLM